MMESMYSTQRVRRAILGQPVDRQPICGWDSANLTDELTAGRSGCCAENAGSAARHISSGTTVWRTARPSHTT